MQIGSLYTVTAAANQYALLYSLVGPNGSTGSGNCTFTPTDDVTVTARFDHDTAHQVYIPNGNSYYRLLQAAYNAAVPGATIKTWSQGYGENLTCDSDKAITLKGGYNQGYTSVSGRSTLNGILTIRRGRVTIEGVAVK